MTPHLNDTPRIVATSGAHTFTAILRNGAWDVELVGYAFASGLTEAEARECIRRLKHAHMTRQPERKAVSCAVCGRVVGLVLGRKVATHHKPGAKRICTGSGSEVQP